MESLEKALGKTQYFQHEWQGGKVAQSSSTALEGSALWNQEECVYMQPYTFSEGHDRTETYLGDDRLLSLLESVT